MTRNGIQWLLVAIIYFLLALDVIARVYYFYWEYPWFDRLTHTIGGTWIGLAVLWLVYLSGYIGVHMWSKKRALIFVLCGAALLGLSWECYEVVVQFTSRIPFEKGYLFDSVMDLVMDVVGALVSYLFFIYFVKKEVGLFSPSS